jgi:tRNA pseudouridine-54 N-methylase
MTLELMMESWECILMSLRMSVMADYLKDSGIKRLVKEMELVSNSGLMARNMKVCGAKIKPTAKAGWHMQMVTFTRVTGKMIKPMDLVFMRVTGSKICNMDTESKVGIMATLSIQASSTKARRMAKVDSSGRMDPSMRVTSLMVSSKDLADTSLLILINGTKESLEWVTWKVEESRPGTMAESTKVTSKMARRTVKVFSYGLMETSTSVAGKMASNMELVSNMTPKKVLRNRVNGLKARDKDGWLL